MHTGWVIPMEREICIRLVRRVCTAIFVLCLLLLFNAPVMAEENVQNTQAVLAETEEILGLTEENFSAVAVQLEAVARAEGRSTANQMLYDGFQQVSVLAKGTQRASASGSSLNVIAVSRTDSRAAFAAWMPYILAALGMIFMAFVLRVKRRQRGGRVVYKPLKVNARPYMQYTVLRTYR